MKKLFLVLIIIFAFVAVSHAQEEEFVISVFEVDPEVWIDSIQNRNDFAYTGEGSFELPQYNIQGEVKMTAGFVVFSYENAQYVYINILERSPVTKFFMLDGEHENAILTVNFSNHTAEVKEEYEANYRFFLTEEDKIFSGAYQAPVLVAQNGMKVHLWEETGMSSYEDCSPEDEYPTLVLHEGNRLQGELEGQFFLVNFVAQLLQMEYYEKC